MPAVKVGQTYQQLFSVHRTKGQIFLNDGRILMIQGVRDVFEITDNAVSSSATQSENVLNGEERAGKVVLIGKGIAGLPWDESLAAALA